MEDVLRYFVFLPQGELWSAVSLTRKHSGRSETERLLKLFFKKTKEMKG